MPSSNAASEPVSERKRLGNWLPADESAVAEFRLRLCHQARGARKGGRKRGPPLRSGTQLAVDDDKIIVSPCEAKPYALRRDLKLVDDFWIKSRPYSPRDMVGAHEEELARRFVGGAVYQAFLNAYSYHRWHAPVGGTIVKAYNLAGTYYSCAEAQGPDPEGLNDSQGYTTAMAARAVIVVEADDPAIGQIACVFIGMGEVSSCMVEVVPGQRVAKGEEIGRFQYGGSTMCMLFESGKVDGIGWNPTRIQDPPIVKVKAHLATKR